MLSCFRTFAQNAAHASQWLVYDDDFYHCEVR